MRMLELADTLDKPVERTLLWFLRGGLLLLCILAVVQGAVQDALLAAGLLLVHGLLYLLFVPRLQTRFQRLWLSTAIDLALAPILLYFTAFSGIDVIIGSIVAGLVAVRLGLVAALAVNVLLWFALILSSISGWLMLGEPFPLGSLGSLLVYMALTVVLGYAFSGDSQRQETQRAADPGFGAWSRVYELGAEITSILDSDQLLPSVTRGAVDLTGAEAGVLLLQDPGRDDSSRELVIRAATGQLGHMVAQRLPLTDGIIQRVMQDGIGAFSNQPEHDPHWRFFVERFREVDPRSILCVPLQHRASILGVLAVVNKGDGAPFAQDDLNLLSAFAAQAAVALENARIHRQTDERLQLRLDELTALQRITQELNATLQLDRVLYGVLESAIQITSAACGNVMLMNTGDSGEFTLRASLGYSEADRIALEQDPLKLDPESLLQVIQSGEARLVSDATDASLAPNAAEDGPHTHSALIVPILYEGSVAGLIRLSHIQGNAFTQEDLEFVLSLANQAAIAIGNAIRFEDQVQSNNALRSRNDQMNSLLTIGQKIRGDMPLQETLEDVAYAIQETVGFDVVVISIVEHLASREPMLCRVAASGLPLDVWEESRKIRQPLSLYDRVLRDEYQQGLCYFLPFQSRDDWGSNLHIIVSMPETDQWEEGQWHPHDMLLVPLRGTGGRLIGHISVDEPRDGMRPSRQVLEALTIFANQAAVAVENARLFEDAQEQAQNLRLLNRVSQALTQITEPQQVLNTVVRLAGELLDCELCTVFQSRQRDELYCAVASHGVDLATMDDLCFALGEGMVGKVAEVGTPLLVSDASQAPGFRDLPIPIGSMVFVPIVASGQVMGVLVAGDSTRYALTQRDQVLLSTIADQAAVALESARLFADTQQAAIRLSLLNEIGRRVATQFETQDMLNLTVNALHWNMGFHRMAAFLLDEETQELYVAAADEGFLSIIPEGYRQKVGAGLVGSAAATGHTVLANDALADERFLPVKGLEASSSLSVPIKIGDNIMGVLHAEADELGAFVEEDAAALEIAADHLAVSMQNANLLEQTRRRVAELATVNQIGRALSSALDAEQLFTLIFDQVSNLMDARDFFIALYDESRELIRIEFWVEHGKRQSPVALNMGQGLTSYLLSTGLPILLHHGVETFIEEHGLTLEGEPALSWLGVPMMAEARVIGAIAVQSYTRESAFDEGHLDLMITIAGQAAVAFQNAALFNERERRISELAVLNEMAQAIGSTLDLDALLNLVHGHVGRLIDATNFYIALHNHERDEITFPFYTDPAHRTDWSPRPGGAGLLRRIIETGVPLLFPSSVSGQDLPGENPVDSGHCSAWMGVPMIAEDKVLGVMVAETYDSGHIYDDADLRLLSTVAAQAAVTVRNAQLYQQIVGFSAELEQRVEERTRELEEAALELTEERDRANTLYRITSELGTTLDLDRVLLRALQLFADTLGVEHGTILLLDQGSGFLDLRATLDRDVELPRDGVRTLLTRGVGLAGWVLEQREPVLVGDITQDLRWIDLPYIKTDARSMVIAPLSLGGGDVLGVLSLGHRETDYFTSDHLQLVTAAAAQVAVAVSNSDLYAFITDQADQLGATLKAMQAEADKGRAILESIADGVIVLDHNGRVLLVNPAAEEMLKISAIALEGEHFRHVLGMGESAVDRELAQGLYTELRQQLETVDGESTLPKGGAIRLKSGTRALAVNIAPLITTLGETPGLVAALRDISREAEVERLKNEFISTVSHELRTPMTSIKGYTDLLFLGMAGGLTDAQRNFLQIIKSNADRLTALVNDILDISRIETGRLRLTIEALDLSEIITQTVASFQEQYRDKDLVLEWVQTTGIPDVRGDAARVTQVLTNLIANAWQYTPSGGRVTVSIHERAGFVQVDVSDTGIGIAADDLTRVFDRFYRVDHPVVQEAEGTGLGLSIVKMFVEMLGGEIWVKSKLGVGSTFSFTLHEMGPEPMEAEIIQPDLISAELSMVTRRRPKILLVESNHDLALGLRHQLESEGYHVLLAGSGEDAMWLAQEEHPQLITIDIMLPDMDGFDLLERLKEHPGTAPIPVIIISILGGADTGYTLGVVDYLIKPFQEQQLLHSIGMVLPEREEGESYDLLVVDDDPDILALLERMLKYRGYGVRTAINGWIALTMIKEVIPDLILLDLRMPRMDGYELIQQLKRDESTRFLPIIVITASPVDKERDRVRILGKGDSQLITKPLSLETLAAEIRSAIEERKQ